MVNAINGNERQVGVAHEAADRAARELQILNPAATWYEIDLARTMVLAALNCPCLACQVKHGDGVLSRPPSEVAPQR